MQAGRAGAKAPRAGWDRFGRNFLTFWVLASVLATGLPARQASAANETFVYDTAGRLVTVEHGDGKVTTYALDRAGNRTNVTTEIPGSAGTVSIVNASATYAESQGIVSVAIRRASGTAGAASVNVALSFTGSANSSDASVSPASVSWTAGDGADKTVTVTIVNDTAAESTETFNLMLSGATGVTLGTPASITFTITDDDQDVTPPPAPTDLAANAVSAAQVSLTWNAVADASGISQYRIERCTGAGCSSFTQIATTTTNSFDNTGLSESTSYTYRVRAVDGAGLVGSYSSNATAVTSGSTLPTAPTNLTATATSATQINLSWTASSDSSGISQYRIERCTGVGCTSFTQVATATATSYSNTGLSESTSYTYRVRAVDGSGMVGPYSANATAVSLDVTVPAAPASLSATAASASQIDLSWSAVSDPSGISQYRIERCAGPGCSSFMQIATTVLTSYSNTGLAEATSYTYRVRAVDGANLVGPYSANATRETLDGTAPPAPANFTASAASGSQINLSWTASTDASGISEYRIERCTGAGCSSFNQIATTTSTSYSNTGLAEITSYSYRIRAVDGASNIGSYSSTATAVTRDVTGPSAPDGFSAIAVNANRVELSWAAASDNVGVAGYRVERCTGASCGSFAQIGTTGAGTLSYSDTTTSQLTTYRYRVHAVDAVPNAGAYSATQQVTTSDGTPPSTPTGLSASVISATRIDLSWNAASDNVAVAQYKVYRNGTPVTVATATNYSDAVLQPSTTYSFQVSALDAAGNESALSSSVQATTQQLPDDQPPTVPQGLTGSAPTSDQVNLSWGASTDSGGSGMAGYRVYRNGLEIATVSPSALPSFTDTTVSGTVKYTYYVRAYDNASNTSTPSASIEITTPDTYPPSAPTGLAATVVSSSRIDLSWNVAADQGGSGIQNYRVLRNGVQLGYLIAENSLSDTTVLAGTTYTYTVSARDGANHESPPSSPVSATTPNNLGAVLNRTGWSYLSVRGQTPVFDPNVVVTASGGSGGYTYQWERVSGDTVMTASAPTSNSTRWQRSLPTTSAVFTAVWRCRVTDSASNIVYTPNVFVEFERENGD